MQSSDRSPRPPEDSRRYQPAREIVHSILDDRPANAIVSPSGELFRAIERFHRNVDRVRRDLPAITTTADMSGGTGTDRDLRRRFNRDPQTSSTTLPGIASLSTNPALPPLRSLGTRRGSSATGNSNSNNEPSGRPGQGLMPRVRLAQSTLEDWERTLDAANTSLRRLLDFTSDHPALPALATSPSTAAVHTPDRLAEESRRVKRRKLDADKAVSSFKAHRYGNFGQVEPGQLKMEIVSCDGGLYSNQPSYAAENILKNDMSVYCTKGNRCNIVLRHQDSTSFSLQELVIKAPGSDFSSP